MLAGYQPEAIRFRIYCLFLRVSITVYNFKRESKILSRIELDNQLIFKSPPSASCWGNKETDVNMEYVGRVNIYACCQKVGLICDPILNVYHQTYSTGGSKSYSLNFFCTMTILWRKSENLWYILRIVYNTSHNLWSKTDINMILKSSTWIGQKLTGFRVHVCTINYSLVKGITRFHFMIKGRFCPRTCTRQNEMLSFFEVNDDNISTLLTALTGKNEKEDSSHVLVIKFIGLMQLVYPLPMILKKNTIFVNMLNLSQFLDNLISCQ